MAGKNQPFKNGNGLKTPVKVLLKNQPALFISL